MKISELRNRENYDDNLQQTLQNCQEIDDKYRTLSTRHPQNSTIQWYEHPWLSVYVTPPFCTEGRRYLNAQYRHTPHKRRRLVQALATDIMTNPQVFKRTLKPAFEMPTMENPQFQMWMPGNHRFRRFNFETRTVRVYPKAGFSTDGITREINIRKQLATQADWILPITWANPEHTVFDEPLLEAIPFNREPNSKRQNTLLPQVADIIQQLHTNQASTLTAQSYLQQKYTQFENAKQCFHAKFPGMRFEILENLFKRAANIVQKQPSIAISLTHGDFQPGNLLIPTDIDKGIWLIDWEDADIRASIYDVMTWNLQSRAPSNLHLRVKQCLQQKDTPDFKPHDTPELAIALWFIEEAIWQLETSSRQGIQKLPQGLCQFFRECTTYINMHTSP